LGILIFKGLTGRRLYKSFGVKELMVSEVPLLFSGLFLSQMTMAEVHTLCLFRTHMNIRPVSSLHTTAHTFLLCDLSFSHFLTRVFLV
jgi:hypothetical protein